jgi:hypothetical protein
MGEPRIFWNRRECKRTISLTTLRHIGHGREPDTRLVTCSITCDSTRYHMHCSLSQKTVCNSRILSLESIPHSSQLGL